MGVDSYRVVGTCNQVNPCADNVTTFRDISFLPVEQSLEPSAPFHPPLPTFLTLSLFTQETRCNTKDRSFVTGFFFILHLVKGRREKKKKRKKKNKKESSTTVFLLKIIFSYREKRVNFLSVYKIGHGS